MRRAFFIGAGKFAPTKFICAHQTIGAHQTVSGNGRDEPHKLRNQPGRRD